MIAARNAGLRAVEADAPPVYPLPLGATLTRFEHVNVAPAALLGGELVAVCGATEALASALLLRFHAYADQDPGGTLPVGDGWLASLAGCDSAAWARRRSAALHGWSVVRVRDRLGGGETLRLAHPEVTREAERLYALILDREDQVSAAAVRKARERLRKALIALGADRRWLASRPVETLRVWLRARGMKASEGNIETAITDLGPQW